MELLELVKNRRDGFVFLPDPVSEETVAEILEIAGYAPCRWGGDPVQFNVVRNKDLIRQLAACKSMGTGPLAFCTVAIVPMIDGQQSKLWREDLSVVSTYIMLACEERGLGCNWVHMDGRMGPDGSDMTAVEAVRDLMGIPENFEILNILAIGYNRRLQPDAREFD
jgi:nitroreductase